MTALTKSRVRAAELFDATVPLLLVGAGMLHPKPVVWLACLGAAFAALVTPVLGGAGLMHLVSLRTGERIQGERRSPALIPREAFETSRAMFVAATLAAWPLAQWWLGHPTGMVWDLAPLGVSPTRMVVTMLLGVVGMDAWLYWKHRLLHTRLLFPFHKGHHHFRDPTAFAGFAVGPVESVMTFWPILLLCFPWAVHWAPMYILLVSGFVALNFYLHCGVTYRFIEATLPKLGLNTSAFHNVHHSHANVNFGEAMYVWDVICKTRLADRERR